VKVNPQVPSRTDGPTLVGATEYLPAVWNTETEDTSGSVMRTKDPALSSCNVCKPAVSSPQQSTSGLEKVMLIGVPITQPMVLPIGTT